MAANPISCPMNVDIFDYLAAGYEVVTSTPRIRLANVADIAVHVGAQIQLHGVALALELLGGLLQRRRHLLLGMGARVVEDLAALGPGLVADRPTPGRGLPSSPSRSRPARLRTARPTFLLSAAVLATMASRSPQHLQDRRHDECADHAEHDQEDDQHEEEGAVGDEEVVASRLCCLAAARTLSARVTHHGELARPGVAKTNSAMNARLMK